MGRGRVRPEIGFAGTKPISGANVSGDWGCETASSSGLVGLTASERTVRPEIRFAETKPISWPRVSGDWGCEMASGSGAGGVPTLRRAALEFDKELGVAAGAVAGVDVVVEMGEARAVALVGDGRGYSDYRQERSDCHPGSGLRYGNGFDVPGVASGDDVLFRRGGLEAEEEGVFEGLKPTEFSPTMAGGRARMPCLRALAGTMDSPSVASGAVDFAALRRLGSIGLTEDIRLLD